MNIIIHTFYNFQFVYIIQFVKNSYIHFTQTIVTYPTIHVVHFPATWVALKTNQAMCNNRGHTEHLHFSEISVDVLFSKQDHSRQPTMMVSIDHVITCNL